MLQQWLIYWLGPDLWMLPIILVGSIITVCGSTALLSGLLCPTVKKKPFQKPIIPPKIKACDYRANLP